MDTGRLGRGEAIAGVSAALLFIVMFLGWFGVPEEVNGVPTGVGFAEAAGIDTTFSAWQSYDFTDLLLLVTIVVAVGGAIATLMARDVAMPVAVSALTAGLGILSFIFVGWSIINTPSEGPVDLDRELWVFVGLVLTVGIAYGGWLAMREEGTSFSDQADRFGDRSSGPSPTAGTGGGAPSAPPTAPEGTGSTPPPPPSSGGTSA
jgi:hypothetical protein